MTTRRPTCPHCAGPLPVLARADAIYCSDACRVAAWRARQPAESPVPLELRSRGRWVRHVDKRPITVGGRPASTAEPSTWTTWTAATAATVGDGVGFVLAGDGIVCVDLDDCLVDGRVAPWARRLLGAVPKSTYTETSPSGHGLHVWGRANVAQGRVLRVPGGSVEVYPSGRYMTVTGRRRRGSPSRLAPIGAWIAGLVALHCSR